MAANVLFKLLTEAQWDALATKDNGTLYRVSKTGGGEDFYQGSNKLNNAAEIQAAIDALDVSEFALATNASGVVTIKGIKEVDGEIAVGTDTTKDVVFAKAATTGAAEDISVADEAGLLNASNVEDALEELAEASAGGVASKTVYITETSGSTSDPYSKRYGLYQGANGSASSPVPAEKLVDIDIPKDMFVESGSVGTVTTPDVPYEGAQVGDKYIDLVLANATSDHIYIPANSLVDVYTAQPNATQIQLAIDSNNVISATVVAGSIGTTELADDAVTAAKVSIAAHTESHTAGADGIAVSVTTTDGQVSAVSASIAAETYDEFGAAANAKAEVIGQSGDAATASTIFGAKAYADSLAPNYDPAGSASTAEANAKTYADGLLTWQTV